MKKIQFVLVASVMALVGCTDQQFMDDALTAESKPEVSMPVKNNG